MTTTQTKLDRDLATLSDEAFTRALAALQRFERRQSRREHPDGSFDQAKRWYPSASEDCGVTVHRRSPSRAFPNSYMVACRTLDHCETLERADHDVVLLVRRWLKAQEMTPCQVPGSALAARRAARVLEAMDAIGAAPVPTPRRRRL